MEENNACVQNNSQKFTAVDFNIKKKCNFSFVRAFVCFQNVLCFCFGKAKLYVSYRRQNRVQLFNNNRQIISSFLSKIEIIKIKLFY
jgi:hypothetical protein